MINLNKKEAYAHQNHPDKIAAASRNNCKVNLSYDTIIVYITSGLFIKKSLFGNKKEKY